MNWSSLQEFLAMGGYGTYVWGSFVVVFGALACECALVRRRMGRLAGGAGERR